MELTEKDLDILEIIADYRFLTTELVSALLPNTSKRSTQRRLRKMFHNSFLSRPKAQVGLRIFSGQRELIYSLGPKGVSALVVNRKMKRSRLSWQTKEIRSAYLAHGLAVSRFRVILSLATRRPKEKAEGNFNTWLKKYKYFRGKPEADIKRKAFKAFYQMEQNKVNQLTKKGLNPNVTLKEWKSGTVTQDHVLIGTRGEKEKYPVYPDGFFKLKFNQGSRDEKSFFLETDKATMGKERFLDKLRAYWWLTKRESKDKLKKELDIDGFRVVTTTPDEKRRDKLVEIAKQADPREIGSEMFMFTTEDDYELDEPESILERIFVTPTDSKKKSILE